MNDNLRQLFSSNRHGVVLGCFALVVTAALALTQTATKSRIEYNEKIHRQKTLSEVLPAQWYDHPLDQFIVELPDNISGTNRTSYIAKINAIPQAVIISATATDGYAGNINLLVGILKDGTISGVRVTKHNETPGLGDAIELKRSEWIKSFDGKSLLSPIESGWALRKNNGEFDQFTGATITPRAVVNEVEKTLRFFNAVKTQLLAHE